MPKRFCTCSGCSHCGQHPGNHNALFDADLTGSLKCPGCQQIATAQRNARPSSSTRGYDGEYQRNKPIVIAQGRDGRPCWICGRPFDPSEKVTVEHKTPLRRGGTSKLDNLAPAHSGCNTGWNRSK